MKDHNDWKRVPQTEREEMIKVMTELSIQQIRKNKDDYQHVMKAVEELTYMLEFNYQFYDYQSIALVKFLQDILCAQHYERMKETLSFSKENPGLNLYRKRRS